jgi:hypothetical protein
MTTREELIEKIMEDIIDRCINISPNWKNSTNIMIVDDTIINILEKHLQEPIDDNEECLRCWMSKKDLKKDYCWCSWRWRYYWRHKFK